MPASSPAMGMSGPVGHQRGAMLHMIEETARHVGRLDVMRELLDGARGP